MASVGLRRLRIWIIFVSFINLALMVANYAIYAETFNSPTLSWMDWAEIILCVVIFFSYIYAVKGKPFLHKFIRAFLILAISVLLLYINLNYVASVVSYANSYSGYTAFQCESGDTLCYVSWASVFVSIITGFFVVIDLFWTLKSGPLEQGSSQYGRYGYGEQANVTIVSPEQPQPQQAFYHQMQPLAANPGQKIEEQFNTPILETTQPYVYQQQPYMYQQPQLQPQPQPQLQPQQPEVSQSQYQPRFNIPYQGSQGYSPQPFVQPTPQ